MTQVEPIPRLAGSPEDADATEFFRALFELHPAPAWAFDEKSLRFLSVNDAVLRKFGYTRGQFLAMTVRDVSFEDDIGQLTTTTGEPVRWRHRMSSGILMTTEVTSQRIVASDRTLRLVIANDATDRRRAEGALKERDDLLRNVLNHVPCGVFWKDKASIYSGCNDQAARDRGLTVPGEVIGRTDYELANAIEEAESIRANDRQVVASGMPLLDVEETRTLADGKKAIYLTNRVPLRDSAGQVIGVVGVSQNVTERKRLEDQLRHSQKMEAVGRLAGGVAHDFNNLLTVITGSVHLLRLLPPGDKGIASYVDDIQAAVDRATTLTRQLLAFSRKQPSRPAVLDVNEVVTGLASLLRRLIGERIAVKTALAPVPVRVRADRGHLEQVLMNLAVNAKDAMPDGGTLHIATSADDAPHFARFTISDTGIGMTDEVKTKIFEPFFTTKELGKGTGLGLATVHGIVEQAGGSVEVASAVGSGTTFAIRLPWCEAPTEPAVSTPSRVTASTPKAGRTVLLVEDEDRIRKLARTTLEGAGFAVIDADRGEAALRSITPERHIDLLVTDMVMPGMDGSELAAQLRVTRPKLAVVMVSGYVPDTQRLEGFPNAVFLPKPFTPFELIRCAERAMRSGNPVE